MSKGASASSAALACLRFHRAVQAQFLCRSAKPTPPAPAKPDLCLHHNVTKRPFLRDKSERA